MIPENAIKLIKFHKPYRAYAYDDANPAARMTDPRYRVRGRLRIGHGHTNDSLAFNSFVTESQAHDLLLMDLGRLEVKLSRLVKVDLNDNQKGALLSFMYDTGGYYFSKRSNKYLPYRIFLNINDGMPDDELRDFWYGTAIKDQGIVMDHLIRLRQDEVLLYFTPVVPG